ncbi:MAG: gliding motility-associated C-terminal domain-containing protein [Bacteroidota bacterium]
MKQTVKLLLILAAVLSPHFVPILAQNNLSVSFENPAAVPDDLNVCGDWDTETVIIGLDGVSPNARQNISATANLFKGVQFEAFDTLGSTSGVTYDASDPSRPIFFIPDLDPSGLTTVRLRFSISANCEYADTLAANDAVIVADVWDFSYDLNGTNLQESDTNTEYRDAFAVTSLTLGIENTHGPARIYDCFSRDIVITNAELGASTDTVIYTNTYQSGLRIDSVQVNGISAPLTKVPQPGGDTLYTLVLDSTYFRFNTLETAGPGNGDGLLDTDESVRITEFLCVISCGFERGSTHTAEWGCGGRSCTMTTFGDFIRLGEGDPNVDFIPFASVAPEDVGYCKPGISTVTFTNDGVENDPGFGTMIDVAVGLGMGNSNSMSDGAFTITSLSIAGQTIAAPTFPYRLDNDPIFLTDPDGPGVGLEDFDGDGYFDDLEIGEGIEVIANYEFDCSLAEELGIDSTCANNFNSKFSARLDYTDRCDLRRIHLEDAYSGINNNRSEFENLTDPDAFLEEDTFYVTHTETRTIRFFDRQCSGNELLVASVVMPGGVSPIMTETMLLQGDSYSFPLASSNIVGDTLFLNYDASFVPFLNGEYTLQLAFMADCTTPLGPTEFPIELAFECPDCACRHIWYCGDLDGPQLHANIPPCPPDVFNCPLGVRTYAFEVNRTTLGFTDNTYSTPISPDSANLKVAIPCDSVEIRVMNVLGDSVVNNISDSLGIVITYDNIDGTNSTEETFLFDFATIRMTNGGTEHFCTIDPSVMTVTSDTFSKRVHFDLGPCLNDLGLTLAPSDTVEFIGNFTVNPDGPFEFEFFRTVPNLRGYGYAIIDDNEYACDNFGEVFSVAKNEATFTFPYTTIFPMGCEERYLEYRLSVIDNEFSDWFGTEHRQSVKVDSIEIIFDPNVLVGFAVFEPEVIIPDHPIYGNSPIPMPGFDEFPSGRYVARFDTLISVPSYATDMTTPFNFRIRTVPNCRSMTGSSMGSAIYDFDPTIHYIDRHYASLIGDGSCADQNTESANNDIEYSEPPTFTLNAISNPNIFLAGDTAIWELQHCNTSFTSDAGLTWIGFEDPTESVEIVSIEDISNPANVTALDIEPYWPAGNYFAFTPQLLRSDGLTSQEDRCNTLRVKAVIRRCGRTDFIARVGWNCTTFPDTAWTPEVYAPCEDLTANLSVTTLDAFLSAAIDEQPTADVALCDTSTVGILVRNTDRGIAFDVSTQVILPLDGIELVPGSFEVAYPSGAAYTPIAANPVYVGSSPRGRIFQFNDFEFLSPFLDQNGLPGFDPIAPTDSNEFRIRYKFVTDCDFVSGSISYYGVRGRKGCGEATNLEIGETLPLNIIGAGTGPSKIFNVYFDSLSGIVPASTATLRVIAKNLTSTPTSSTEDKISLRLPVGIDYVANSTLALAPDGWVSPEPQVDIQAGYQTLLWCLPDGMVLNDSAMISFEVISPDLDCSIQDTLVELFTITRNNVSCALNGSNCDLNAITSTNVGELTSLPVNQRLLDFRFNSITSTCQPGGEEQILVDGYIVNFGPHMSGSPVNIFYYNDLNVDGTFDPGEPELASFSVNGPMNHSDSIVINHSFNVDFNSVCDIVALIDSTGLGLCDRTELILPNPVLQNVGTDEVICADAPTTINMEVGDAGCGVMTNYVYNWTAIAPASISDLSASNIPNPILDVPHNAVTEDTLMYVLETSRTFCGFSTTDTLRIIRGASPIIDPTDNVSINLGDSVTLTLTVNGGTLPYTYSWQPDTSLNDGQSATPMAWPTVSTDYMVTVTSATGCTATSSVRVNVLNVPVDTCITPAIEGITTLATTCGKDDGRATIIVGGSPNDFSFSWQPDLGTSILNGAGKRNLPAGGYVVTIERNGVPGCTSEVYLTIGNSDGPMPTTVTTTPSSCTGGDGTATLTPASMTYQWSDGGAGANRTDLAAGTYFVTVVDPSVPFCPNIILLSIDTDNPLSAAVNVLTAPDCGTNNGTVQLDITGGSGDYTINWPSGNTTAIENNLSAGSYSILVEDNINNCSLTVPFLLSNSLSTATVSVDSVYDLSCSGAMDGSIAYTVTYDPAFALPADTTITDGIGTYTNGQLPPGDYCLVITDATGCSTNNCFRINAPDSLYLAIAVTENCGGAGSSIEVDAQGGKGPYTFDWADLPGSDDPEDRSGLADGAYSLTLTDASGCSLTEQLFIDACPCDPPATSSTVIMQATCGNSDGMAAVNMQGNTADYEYLWSPDIGTANVSGNSRSDLPAGGYTVTIRDLTDTTCSSQVFIAVTNSDGPQATANTLPATCQSANGIAEFSPSGFTYNWPDGSTTDSRGDLTSGVYFVTFTDPADPTCPNIITVTIEEDNPLMVTSTVNTQPDCQMSNGSVTLSVTGGSGNYTYTWDDGVETSSDTRNDLAAGTYQVTITDTAGDGCSMEYLVTLSNANMSMLLTITDTIDASCFDSDDGGVSFEVNYGVGFAFPADTIITDGTNNYSNNALPAGDYCIMILDANNCVAGSACFDLTSPDSLGLHFIVTPSCNADATVDTEVSGGNPPYTFDWLDIDGTDDPEDRTDLSFGVYSLIVTDALGCTAAEDSLMIPACPDIDCNYFGSDTLVVQATSCDGLADLCIGLQIAEQNDYSYSVNGQEYTGNLVPCDVDTLVVYLYGLIGDNFAGPYEVTTWEVNDTTYSGDFATFEDLVDSMNVWDPSGNWQIDTTDSRISGGNPANDYGNLLVQVIGIGFPNPLGISLITDPNSFAIQLDTGTHEVVVTSLLNGCSDTVEVFVLCTTPDTVYIDQVVGEMDTVCLDTTELFGNTFTINNECPDGTFSEMTILGDSCVVFTGIQVGGETACLTICDEYGICDTTYVIITVDQNEDVVIDTIQIGEVVVHCIDTAILDLTGPAVTIENICPALSEENVHFEWNLDSLCVTYVGLEPGTDTACIRICDAAGICDTIDFYIHVLNSSIFIGDSHCDTVFVNQTIPYCPDTSELFGEVVSIRNVCPDETTDAADLFIDPVSFCVEYTGLDIGSDTACIEICDNFGLCDTTYLCLTIAEYTLPPIAVDDCDTIEVGRSKPINIKLNDTLFGGVTEFTILEPPVYGTVGLPGNLNEPNLDCSVTYNASDEFCERRDSFTYEVCTPTGCDTATVCVWLECIDIVIFTAVSPNNDGINDVFYVAGIEEYPNNELTIFNRWGNRVYQTAGYQNDWMGKWDGDKDLPDGSYFYLLKLNDEQDRVFTGYFELYR